jgi:hypothetical protein
MRMQRAYGCEREGASRILTIRSRHKRRTVLSARLEIVAAETAILSNFLLKEWLRQHPQHIPAGADPTSNTSHQLRNALRRAGWQVQETASETRLLMPGTAQADGVVEAVLGNSAMDEQADSSEAAFALEFQLRDVIANNLPAIDVGGNKLRLYVDPTGRDGIEFTTPVGPIDILAIDDAADFFVFELKRARSPDHAIGQVARYMGWVQQTIGKDRAVRGIIVAKEISDALRYAVSVVPNVTLFEYQVEFHLKRAHDLR